MTFYRNLTPNIAKVQKKVKKGSKKGKKKGKKMFGMTNLAVDLNA